MIVDSAAVQRLLYVALVSAILTALCIVTIDQPFARWLATRETYPALWNETIGYLEYPLGIEPWRWAGITVLVAGCVITLAVARLRPYAAVFLIVTLTHVLSRHVSLWVKWLTGRLRPTQWLGAGEVDTFWRDGFSFPSGHVLLFASIVIPIVALYPRARVLLVFVAFPMLARVMVNAHFISDVLGGLACVALLTWLAARLIRRVLPSQIQPTSLR
jgi:membrane-associated phospholipid phosphatase